MPTVNIIGAGRVGRTYLSLLGDQVQDVASGSIASAAVAVRKAGQGRATKLEDMRAADLWFLTVPDGGIAEVSQRLAGLPVAAGMAVHCSGFHTASVMSPLGAKGWRLASAHPNLSFADTASAVAAFAGTPVGVEGDAEAVRAVAALMTGIGARVFEIASDQKTLYHAAAVISNNFTTVLQAVAREAWETSGVPHDLIPALNATLLDAAAQNVRTLGPVEALTGPAARGDVEVVAAELEAMACLSPEAGEVYRLISDMAARLKAKGTAT